MADEIEVKAIFQSACVVKNRKHVAMGEVKTYNVENDASELTNLRAAGRIAPVTKENVEKMFELLTNAGNKAPKSLLDAAKELKIEAPAAVIETKAEAKK